MKEMTSTEVVTQKPARMYKDRLFRMIFSNKKELLSLYNAMNGTNYLDPEELQINTLENAIYMGMRNDLSFLIDSHIPLYEHQSTYNPNIPLRDFMYVSSLYSKLVHSQNLYGSKLIKIPTPKFVVFYNGREEQPERKEMKLSDAYEVAEAEICLELKVLMLNINPGYNQKLMKDCKTLRDYMDYVERVRTYTKVMSLEDAVEQAILECIKDNILADVLRNHRAEVKNVSIFEYDEEQHMRQVREEGVEEGLTKGIVEGKIEAILELLEEFGTLPADLKKSILEESDPSRLKEWLKTAAKAESISAFEEALKNQK